MSEPLAALAKLKIEFEKLRDKRPKARLFFAHDKVGAIEFYFYSYFASADELVLGAREQQLLCAAAGKALMGIPAPIVEQISNTALAAQKPDECWVRALLDYAAAGQSHGSFVGVAEKSIEIIERVELLDSLNPISKKAPLAEQTDPVTRAIALLIAADKDGKRLIKKDLPGIVGCSRSTLYRNAHFRATISALKTKKRASIPNGSKSTQGTIEAEFDPDEE